MADYISILNNTISGLQSNTPEIRKAVYGKARQAIETKLRNIQPTPSEEVIQAQLAALEDAIGIVEGQFVVEEPPVAELEVQEPTPLPEESPVEPSAETPVEAAPEFGAVEPAMVEPETAPIQTPAPAAPVTTPAAPIASPEQENPVLQQPAMDEFPAPPTVEEEAFPAIASTQNGASMGATPDMATPQVMPEPQLANDGSGYAPEIGGVAPSEHSAPQTAGFDEPGLMAGEAASKPSEKRKRSWLPIILPVVFLCLLAAIIYPIYVNFDDISEAVIELTQGDASVTSETPIQPEDESAAQTETATGETTAPQQQETATTSDAASAPEQSQTEVPPVGEEEAEPAADPAANTQADTESQPEEIASNEDAVRSTDGDTNSAPLGEVAYLYQEGSAGNPATQSQASVSWELIEEKPDLLSDSPAEAKIVGRMEVPETGMKVFIKIQRNVDAALPASHIIELNFEMPADNSSGSIHNIARFVMKPTEQARGDELTAVPVKIEEGKFLIALDNLDQAVLRNRDLLLASSWIDIPFSYSSGKRGLLTMEKGGTGTQVFKDAFADWRARR